jgi:hypothetical protein
MHRRTLLAALGAFATSSIARADQEGELVGGSPAPILGNLTFRFEGGIVLDASVNAGPAAPFLLDTGSTATILSAEFAAAQGLRPNGGSAVIGVKGEGGKVDMLEAGVLRVGGMTLPPRNALVMTLPNHIVDHGRRPRLAGLIGLNAFGPSILRIEWAAQRIELLPPEAAPDPAGLVLPLATSLQYSNESATAPLWRGASVSAMLDGMRMDLALDTGFGGMVSLNEPFVREEDLLSRYRKHADFDAPGGIDGRLAMSLAIGGVLALGDVTVDQPLVAMTRDVPPENGLRDGIGLMRHIRPRAAAIHTQGLLGLGVLMRYKPFIDLTGQRLVLEPRVVPLPKIPPGWRTVGLSLDKPAQDYFQVLSVIPGTPAAHSPIREGDRIVSVNGMPARDLALFDYSHMEFAGPLALRFADGSARTLVAEERLLS